MACNKLVQKEDQKTIFFPFMLAELRSCVGASHVSTEDPIRSFNFVLRTRDLRVLDHIVATPGMEERAGKQANTRARGLTVVLFAHLTTSLSRLQLKSEDYSSSGSRARASVHACSTRLRQLLLSTTGTATC
jgi:hypothetical protein